jgi:hypothetical protein
MSWAPSGQTTDFSDMGAILVKARAVPAEKMMAATINAVIILGFIVSSPIKCVHGGILP